MSYTYRLLTARGGILPAAYPLDITASGSGLTPLTRSFAITVSGQPAQAPVDTVRTLVDLLTNIWRDGQSSKSLTTQDVRDTILSLALQRGDFSRLPTSPAGLPSGRAYVDAGVVRVNV
jgi:hypothetical protein